MKNLDEKEWHPFPIESLFNEFENGKAKGRNHLTEVARGGIDYIGATNRNNGVLCHVAVDDKSTKMIQQGNCIGFIRNGDGAAGYAIYKATDFISTSDVYYGYSKWLDVDTGLFFVASQDLTKEKYSHGHKRSPERLHCDKVMLPNDTTKKEPDYAYMAEYTQKKRNSMLKKYLDYIEKRLAELGDIVDILALDEKEWYAFNIMDLFQHISKGKISNASKLTKTDQGGIEYIAATNRNNGCLYFLENNSTTRAKLQKGNCIGFIKDGDGSAGYAIYKREAFTSTVNVLYGYSDWLNVYNGLFFVVAQDMIQSKYSHGNKRNIEHLSRDKVMLPINKNNNPDYAYMEQYTKNVIIKKYRQYLAYIKKKYDI